MPQVVLEPVDSSTRSPASPSSAASDKGGAGDDSKQGDEHRAGQPAERRERSVYTLAVGRKRTLAPGCLCAVRLIALCSAWEKWGWKPGSNRYELQ